MEIDPRIYQRFGDHIVGSSGDELIYLCPFCEDNGKTPDTKGHLYVNNKKLVYFCQRCGARGHISSKATDYIYDPIPSDEDMLNTLGDILGKNESDNKRFRIPQNLVDINSEAGRYLLSREVSKEMIKYYSIRQGEGKNRNRVIVPNQVFYEDNKDYTDMYVGRYIKEIPKDSKGHDAFPKYKNPVGVSKSHIVFNLHRIPQESPIIICEGVFSAISAGIHAVAIYGKTISNNQLSMILHKSPSKIYVCLDPDAYKESLSLCYRLVNRTANPIYNVRLPNGHDPNSLGHSMFMKFLLRTKEFDTLERSLELIV